MPRAIHGCKTTPKRYFLVKFFLKETKMYFACFIQGVKIHKMFSQALRTVCASSYTRVEPASLDALNSVACLHRTTLWKTLKMVIRGTQGFSRNVSISSRCLLKKLNVRTKLFFIFYVFKNKNDSSIRSGRNVGWPAWQNSGRPNKHKCKN